MKKLYICIIIVMMLLLLSSCRSDKHKDVVKDGTYVMVLEEPDEGWSPCLTIAGKDISFSYDALSNYFPYGTYSIDDDTLTMTTSDNKFKYVFHIKGDKLIFIESESSSVKLIDSRCGVRITDQAVFSLAEHV